MSYTPCYESRYLKSIGGIFISADGTRRTIPDCYLHSAKLQSDSTLLRLSYSSCIVDIIGYRLTAIYNDVVIGKLGTVAVSKPADAESASAKNAPYVTSIVYLNMSPGAAFDLESRNA